jgi:hypothetical protein
MTLNHKLARALGPGLPLLLVLALMRPASAQLHADWISSQYPSGNLPTPAKLLAVDPAGNVLVAGLQAVETGNIVVVKLSPSGSFLWATPLPTPPLVYTPRRMRTSSTGMCAVVGWGADSAGVAPAHAVLSVLDALGNAQWSVVGPGSGGNGYRDVAFDAAGNVVVCGSEGGFGVLTKYDALGNLVWQGASIGARTFHALAVEPGGDVFAASKNFDGSYSLARFASATGQIVWNTLVSQPSGAEFTPALLREPGGDMAVAGLFAPTPWGSIYRGVTKVDAQGNILWQTVLTGVSSTLDGYGLALDVFGRLVVEGGISVSSTQNEFDVAVLSSTGVVQWVRSLPYAIGTTAQANNAVATDSTGQIFTAAEGLARGIVGVFDASGEHRFVWDPHASNPSNFPARLFGVASLPNGGLVVAGDSPANKFYVSEVRRTATAYCFGDGSGTACPCGNTSPVTLDAGCTNSTAAGARLVDNGASSLTNDTLILSGSDMPNSFALYFQGTQRIAGGSGVVFGDGLRCSGGTVMRLGVVSNTGGTSQYPRPTDLPVSIRGLVPTVGSVRDYQVWYRNSVNFCTSETSNLSNGVEIVWTN